MDTTRAAVWDTVERLIAEVSSWPNVDVGEHRFGGTEFRVGPREIGHVHEWGMLDVAYLRALRDVLVEEGETGVHHLLAESGWTPNWASWRRARASVRPSSVGRRRRPRSAAAPVRAVSSREYLHR